MKFFRGHSNKFLTRKICKRGLCFRDSDLKYSVQAEAYLESS